ncbi:ANTAR domain-containing protein [Amycolatopsis sp. NPDC059657]|uniref:ANTAR domain-containing protein n=1 Tax=Amycolatopsis sp. NPDC059657 TaxID=3346899 RepID=UPI0036718E85
MSESVDRLVDHLDEVTDALDALTTTLDREPDLDVMLQAVCDQVVRVVPGADLASVTLIRDGVPETAVSTDTRANDIDAEQYRHDDGPCVRAARTGTVVRVRIEDAARYWPEFTAAATDLGVGSYLAAPLPVTGTTSAAINLFGFGDHGFHDTDEKLLELYTTVVTFALRATQRSVAAHASAHQLRAALTTRATIDQAKGILMAAHRITADEAFQKLVARSQQENIKLHEVAARFVAEVTSPN